MEKKKTESLDEIVFKEREKDYGAYYLRRVYKKYTTRAVLISLAIMIMGVLIPFFIFQQTRVIKSGGAVTVEISNLAKPPEDAPPPPPPPPPTEAIERQVRFTAPIVTHDTVDPGQVFNQDELNRSTTNFAVDTTTHLVIPQQEEHEIIVPEMKVFTIVEEYPQYPGGDVELIKYLQSNVKYPEMAKDNGIQGVVWVQFVVNSDGSITDVRRKEGTREVGAGCDEEAFRVIKSMPKWTPGKQSGKNVRVQMVLPVRFKLD